MKLKNDCRLEEQETEQSLIANGSSTAAQQSLSDSQATFEEHSTNETNRLSPILNNSSDNMLDLLRAIEMSRLQAVRETEQNTYRPNININNISNFIPRTEAVSNQTKSISNFSQSKTDHEYPVETPG